MGTAHYVDVGGRQVRYLECGVGAPILLVHGWIGSAENFHKWMPGARGAAPRPSAAGPCATTPSRSMRLDRARAYASGRLELRLEESRHLSAWLGIQEALHERVLTLDDALAELNKVRPDDVQALAQQLFRDDALCLAVISTPRTTSGLEKALTLS